MLYKLVKFYTRKFSFPKRGLKYMMRAMRFLGISGKSYIKKLPDEVLVSLEPEDHIQRQLFWYGYYEKSVGSTIISLLTPTSTLIDIGANIGYFSLLAAKISPTVKVIAFEPVSYLFNALTKNIELNNFKNIQAVNAAIGDENGSNPIYLSSIENRGMSSFQKPENYSGQIEMVNIFTLDNWIADNSINRVDLIKIDVEGYELSVLKGMAKTIITFKPNILLELNPETLSYFDLHTSDILSYTINLHYHPFTILDNGKFEKLNKQELNETINVLLVHDDNLNSIGAIM